MSESKSGYEATPSADWGIDFDRNTTILWAPCGCKVVAAGPLGFEFHEKLCKEHAEERMRADAEHRLGDGR